MGEWYVIFKVKQGKVMQGHPRSCNIAQSHATLRKITQRPARSCNVKQGHAKLRYHARQVTHPSLISFTLLSRRFACTQAFPGGWGEVVV